jgi:hypothetical protein
MQNCDCHSLALVSSGRLVGMIPMDSVGEFLLLQAALHRRLGGECALVEFLDNQGDNSGSWPIHGLLKTVARKAHLDFFSHIVGPRVGEALFEPTREIQDAASQGLA